MRVEETMPIKRQSTERSRGSKAQAGGERVGQIGGGATQISIGLQRGGSTSEPSRSHGDSRCSAPMQEHDSQQRAMATRCRRCRQTRASNPRSRRSSANRCGRVRVAVWLPLVAVTLLNAVQVAVATSAASSSSDFTMDGATTYCWEVDTSIYSNTVDGSSVQMTSAKGDGCPLELSLTWPTGDVYAYDAVDISWNATLREGSDGSLLSNDFGLTNLSVGEDRISQKYYEITASRLRTCLYGADCNPVTTGSQLTENTTNVPMNFSTDGLAEFDSSELSFDAAGNYTLLAHLILPSSTPTSKRYDYAVSLEVQVLSRSSATTTDSTTTQPYSESTSDSSSSGVSTEVICVLIIAGIVVVALAAIGFVTLRSKTERPPEPTASKHTSKRRGMFGFAAGTSSTGALAVVSDGDEEFAMLSMHEATMRRNSTYLSALNRGRRSSGAAIKKNDSPIQFAGPMCRKGALADEDNLSTGDITPQSITIETPATGRGNYTEMAGLENTSKSFPPKNVAFDQFNAPRHIMFNDIMEDEVDSSGPTSVVSVDNSARPTFDNSVSSTVTDLNLTAVSVRIKQHRANAEQQEVLQVKEDVLTADDLRDSEAQGPLALSDLYSSRIKR